MNSSLMINKKLTIYEPSKLRCLLYKFVTVKLKENHTVTGFVDFIDTEPNCIGVIEYTKPFKTIMIPAHAILSISEIKPKNIRKRPITIAIDKINPLIEIYLKERKKKVITWLREVFKNSMSVKEEGENITLVDVIIFPPYTGADILTPRSKVAHTLKLIIELMPDDS